jgi:type I restriction enzyme, S subunit
MQPKLRFPEFQDANGWRVTKLNSLLFEAKHRNRSLELGPADVLSVSGEYGCVNQIEFMGRSYAGATVKDYHVVEHGDIVYTKSPLKKNPFGIIKENKGKRGIVSTLYAVYRPFPECCSTYLDHFFSVDFHLNSYLQPIVRKGAKNDMKVNNADVLKGDICVPTLPEQQKIADCLDSVDALIAAQGRKVVALRAHKKGLMQKLFPQEGETQPRLRLPEFEGAGEWEEKAIGDFGQVVTGSTPSTADPTLYGGGIPFVSPADISELRYVDETRTTLTAAGFENTRPIRAGSVLFVCIGSTIGKIAQNVRDCATNQQINSVIPNPKHSDGFVYFALSNASDRIALLAGKQAVPIINKSLFSSVRLLVPSLPEQRRIANCLTSLDDLIAAETRKLDTLKTHKKGLMQQLFPSVVEVDA